MLLVLVFCPTSFFVDVYSQEQTQSTDPNEVLLATNESMDSVGANGSEPQSVNPVTIGALTSIAMNKLVLNVTQNLLSETARLLELDEFVLRVSAQEFGGGMLNLSFEALDSQTSTELAGVSLNGWLANMSGTSAYFFTGLTDNNGKSSFLLPTRADELTNMTLTIEAFHRGYLPQKQSAIFAFG